MPALVRFVLSTPFSFSSKAAAVSGTDLRRKKPSCGCAVPEERGRCSWRRRTQISLGVRTLFQQEEEGRRSEGTMIDPALEIVDLSRYL